MKTILLTILFVCLSMAISASEHPANSAKNYRGPYDRSYGKAVKLVRSPKEQAKYVAKVDWYHKAKYGLMYCFLADMHEFPVHPKWTSEKWNALVDAVDVEKVAAQANEVGAGYVILSLGQNCRYYCAPNPVFEKHWEFTPNQYGSKRDLPMDLYKALKKYNIRMMLYMGTERCFANPAPASLPANEKWKRWEETIQWYSDHYGKKCSGWWLDGLADNIPGEKNWPQRIHAAVKHGNPDAVTASGVIELSEFHHGHCGQNWGRQQLVLPYYGRWDPEFNVQWQAFQYLGHTWSAPGLAHSTASMVNYAKKVVQGGGVITFDVGTFDRSIPGPSMVIKEDQMTQLRAIRDALKDIPATDGEETRQATLQSLFIRTDGDRIYLNDAWPKHWTSVFKLQAPQETTIEGRVEDGKLVKLKVTPEDRRKDVVMPLVLISEGKQATASADYSKDYDAAKAFDGNMGTRWSAPSGHHAAWLAVDLGKPIPVRRAVIHERSTPKTSKFALEAQMADGSWKAVATGTTLGANKTIDFEPVTAQMFRLNILANPSIPTIDEFLLYCDFGE